MKVVTSVISKTLFAMLLTISFTSCATIISGTKADIFIDGDVEEPVTINSSAGEYKDVTLPTLVEVKRHQLDGQHIQITSEHHTFDDIVLKKSFNGLAIVSALMYGTPFIIDLATNAVSKPKYDQFYIIPTDNVAEDDTLHGKRPMVTISTMGPETRARLRSQQLPAKYPRHEINVTLGFGANQADYPTQHFIDGIIQPRHMEIEGECGDIFGNSYLIGKMEYHYRLNRKWDIGALMAWGKSSDDYTNEYYQAAEQIKDSNPVIITRGSETGRSFSFAPSVRYTWYERKFCRFYSHAALGVMRNHLQFDLEARKANGPYEPLGELDHKERFDNTKWRLAYQLSPVAMSFGADPVRFFIELGYGCLGVCNIGLGFSF